MPVVQTMACSVHGEYRFSALPMLQRPDFKATGGRLSGEDMRLYMEDYAFRFVKENIRYNVEVLDIRRARPDAPGWVVTISDQTTGMQDLKFDKIVLCTGVCRTHSH
jgi:dimethylaniline monooxygenase (N-oxide forming)